MRKKAMHVTLMYNKKQDLARKLRQDRHYSY